MLTNSEKQRLRELQDAMNAKRRYSAPPDSEADQWYLGFEDVDDEHGHTITRGIPVWNPKAEHDEFFRIRFSHYGRVPDGKA